MRKYLYTGIGCFLLSAGLHFYLTKRSYELRAGSADSSSICSISEKINCDLALISSYGDVFGLSLSSFGFSFNLALVFLLLLILLEWMEGAFWKSFSVYTGGFIAFVSLFMMGVSLYQKLYCPLCWATYILSYIGFFAVYRVFKQKSLPLKIFVFEALKGKGVFIFSSLALAGAFFIHMFFVINLGLKDIQKTVKTALVDWRREEAFLFSTPSLFTSGPKQSFINLVEFADFLCPHCKKTHPDIKQFLKNHPQVSFTFYTYPLDSQCNKAIRFSNGGLSCYLAKFSLCAKQQSSNTDFHSLIFDHQEDFLTSLGKPEKIQKIKEQLIEKTSLKKDVLLKCLEDKKTHALVEQQAEEGLKAKIPGTPSFFVNGKRLRGGNTLQTLQILYKELQ